VNGRYSTNPNTTGTAAVMETYAKRGVDGVTDEAAVDRGSAGPVQPEATNTARAAFRRSAADTAALRHESVELTRVLPRAPYGPPGPVYPSPPPARKQAVTSPAADVDADPDGVIIAAVVVLISLLGVIATVFAYHQGRVHGSAGMPLYWFGQILVFVPTMVAALRRRPPPLAAAALMAVGLGINQYLIMWLYSPDEFRFPDELQHMTATSIINHTGRLFESNPALPIGSSFPGLAEIGSAVSEVTGLSITTSGMIIAFVCRLVFIGALFACDTSNTAAGRVASRTDSVRADSIARARQDSINRASPGYVVDSVLPVEEELRRFRAAVGGTTATELRHASLSRADIVRRFVRDLSTRDTTDLRRAVIDSREFADLVYPDSPNTRPPYRQSPAFVWMQIAGQSTSGLTRATHAMTARPRTACATIQTMLRESLVLRRFCQQ